MLRFSDIFLIQTIGLLRNRKFSGDCHLQLPEGGVPASLQFSEGVLINATYGNLLKVEALQHIMWCCRGAIEFVQQSAHNNDNPIPIEITTLLETMPFMPAACPLLEALFIERIKHGAIQESALSGTAQALYDNIRSGGIEVQQAKGTLSNKDFWQSLFYLLSTGRLVINYGRTLSPLLLKLQESLIAQLQKNLGKRAADLYDDQLGQEMDAVCPNVNKHKNYDKIYGLHDHIYGTAPYRTWVRLISESISKITSTTLGNVCYKKALTSLKPDEITLLKQLLVE